MTIPKSLAALTAGLMLSSLAIAPALAHKVKSNADSSVVSVTATVAPWCTFASTTPSASLSYSPAGTNTPATISYTVTCNDATPTIAFTSGNGTPANTYDCTAIGGGNSVYYYIQDSNDNYIGCNGANGSTYGSAVTGTSPAISYTLTIDTNPNYLPYIAGTYSDSLTASLSP
jgi:hypothetical protein